MDYYDNHANVSMIDYNANSSSSDLFATTADQSDYYVSSSSSSALPCCEMYGYIAAVLCVLAFGTFGVPIKSDASRSVDIDPLVFQTYKTFMCFVTSWIVLLFGIEFHYTPWGIVSGFFWVPGGIATIVAVKKAGLAITIGVSASCTILVSFTWGIFIFREHVHSITGACLAIVCMICGLCGMAYYSSFEVSPTTITLQDEEAADTPQIMNTTYRELQTPPPEEEDNNNHGNGDNQDGREVTPSSLSSPLSTTMAPMTVAEEAPPVSNNDTGENATIPNREEYLSCRAVSFQDELENEERLQQPQQVGDSNNNMPNTLDTNAAATYKIFSQRQIGISCAVFNGVWVGSVLIPMKFSPPNTSGIGYVISFAIGAVVNTFAAWLIRYLYILFSNRYTMIQSYHALPSFHLRKMWLSGGTAGLLWSIGNFCSILSVKFLGEGVGFSIIQAAMIVSGMWGIFYFKEITGTGIIIKWFISASITVSGIILLSYEHHEK